MQIIEKAREIVEFIKKHKITAVGVEEGGWFLDLIKKYKGGHNLNSLIKGLQVNSFDRPKERAKHIICLLDGTVAYIVSVLPLEVYCLENDEEKTRCPDYARAGLMPDRVSRVSRHDADN